MLGKKSKAIKKRDQRKIKRLDTVTNLILKELKEAAPDNNRPKDNPDKMTFIGSQKCWKWLSNDEHR